MTLTYAEKKSKGNLDLSKKAIIRDLLKRINTDVKHIQTKINVLEYEKQTLIRDKTHLENILNFL